MKSKIAAIVFFAAVSSLFGQGALTPPGAPAPMMKTLSQVEPRTAITNSGAVTISQPGSYYLTTNIAVTAGDAITIATNGVTLDLNGFTISSTAPGGAGSGISLSGTRSDIEIFNGHIVGAITNNGGSVYGGNGFQNGIYAATAPQNIHVSCVSVSGCSTYGILLSYGNSTLVEFCTVQNIGSIGIYAAAVSHCAASYCRDTGIQANTVSDSEAQSTYAAGITATVANNCYGYGVAEYGISANTANGCYGYSTNYYGITAKVANNCHGYSGTSTGLLTTSANNCYGQSVSGTGLSATIAIGCYGTSTSGTGLSATIGNSCAGGGPTPLNVTKPYNM